MMNATESPAIDVVWGPPRNFEKDSRRAKFRVHLVATRAQVITSFIALPIVALVIRWLNLAIPVSGVSLVLAGFILLPWILMTPALLCWRFGPRPFEPRQDLYRLTADGLYLPQARRRDPAFLKWADLIWWDLRKSKQLNRYRIIVLRTQTRIRRLLLPADSRDDQIIEALSRFGMRKT